MQSFKLKNATITCDGIIILKTKDENLANKLKETIENSNNNNNSSNNNDKDFEQAKKEIKTKFKELQDKVNKKTKLYNKLCLKLNKY